MLLIAAPADGAGEAGGAEAGEPASVLAEQGRWDEIAAGCGAHLAAGDASYACVLRDHYRGEKRWADADTLRDEIQAAGFEVRDTPQGTQVVRKA